MFKVLLDLCSFLNGYINKTQGDIRFTKMTETRRENTNTCFIKDTVATEGLKSFCALVRSLAEASQVFFFLLQITETEVSYENMHLSQSDTIAVMSVMRK